MHPIDINKVEIRKRLISDKVSYDKKGLKYLDKNNWFKIIGQKDDEKVRPLCIMLPKIRQLYVILIKDEELLEAYNKI